MARRGDKTTHVKRMVDAKEGPHWPGEGASTLSRRRDGIPVEWERLDRPSPTFKNVLIEGTRRWLEEDACTHN